MKFPVVLLCRSRTKIYAYFRIMVRVIIIGSGNVAKHLFNVFSANEAIKMVQVVSRNKHALKNFGTTINSTTSFSKIKEADIYIIAVSDDAINSVSKELTKIKGLVVHTSGSATLSALSKHKRRGVFYPLQTFSKNRAIDFKNIPICLEAQEKPDLKLLQSLAKKISDNVYSISSEQRKALHLAAIFVNNFTNHLYHIGNTICKENNLPFGILNPLINETSNKIEKLSPYDAQTGPARRNDVKTINTHLEQLKDSDEKEIYAVLSRSIQNTYEKKL